MVATVKKKTYDLLDHRKGEVMDEKKYALKSHTYTKSKSNDNIFQLALQFDADYEEFKQSVEALKEQLQLFVDSWFEKSLSVSCAI